MKTGGQIVREWLEHSGVDCFFNVPGETFLPILDALYDSAIKVVTCRHESGASFAAAAYARSSGKLGVCMASRGPGGCNLTIGVHTAYYEALPVVALIGQVPRRLSGSFAFQEVEMAHLYGSIAKDVLYVADPQCLGEVLLQAEMLAQTGRPGPVVVVTPEDILSQRTDQRFPTAPRLWEQPEQLSSVADDTIDMFLRRVAIASRPVVLSCVDFDDEYGLALQRFAELLNLPVINGWRRYSSFPNSHRQFCGNLGVGAPVAINNTLAGADLIIALGAALEDITLRGAAKWRGDGAILVVSGVVDASGIRRTLGGTRIEFLPVAANAFLRRVNERLSRNESRYRDVSSRWEKHTLACSQEVKRDRTSLNTGSGDPMAEIFGVLENCIPSDALVVSDAGNFAKWLSQGVTFGSRRYLGPLNGAMGYSLPAAIGAKLSGVESPVWAIAGDGGLLMTGGEMNTAVRYGLDIVCVVINNGILGSIRTHQERLFPGRSVGTDLGIVDFSLIAKAMGWKAWRVTEAKELHAVLQDVIDAGGCRLVEILCIDDIDAAPKQ